MQSAPPFYELERDCFHRFKNMLNFKKKNVGKSKTAACDNDCIVTEKSSKHTNSKLHLSTVKIKSTEE